jgi:RNA recognition motif-containing protein
VAIVLDRETGRSRGFAFVEAQDAAAAAALVALAAGGGVRLGGVALDVRPARPRLGGPW